MLWTKRKLKISPRSIVSSFLFFFFFLNLGRCSYKPGVFGGSGVLDQRGLNGALSEDLLREAADIQLGHHGFV